MEIVPAEECVNCFCKISALTIYEFGKKKPVETEMFGLAGQACLAIANFYVENNRGNAIKEIGATFFGHEYCGTIVITFHLTVDLGTKTAGWIEKFKANWTIEQGVITIFRKDSEGRATYNVQKCTNEIAKVIIEHIEKERGKASLSLFKDLYE